MTSYTTCDFDAYSRAAWQEQPFVETAMTAARKGRQRYKTIHTLHRKKNTKQNKLKLLRRHIIRTDRTGVNVKMAQQCLCCLGAPGRRASCSPSLRINNYAPFGGAHCSRYNFCSSRFCISPALAVERTQKTPETPCEDLINSYKNLDEMW